jgi:hypothetical protein
MVKRITIMLEKIILKKLYNIRTKKIEEVYKTSSLSTANSTILDEKSQSWIQTPLSEFGYKCIENKHELCKGCKCLCHFGDTSQINQNS